MTWVFGRILQVKRNPISESHKNFNQRQQREKTSRMPIWIFSVMFRCNAMVEYSEYKSVQEENILPCLT